MFNIFHPFSRVVLHSAVSPSPSLLKRGLAQKNDTFKINLLIRPPPFRIIQTPSNLSKNRTLFYSWVLQLSMPHIPQAQPLTIN